MMKGSLQIKNGIYQAVFMRPVKNLQYGVVRELKLVAETNSRQNRRLQKIKKETHIMYCTFLWCTISHDLEKLPVASFQSGSPCP